MNGKNLFRINLLLLLAFVLSACNYPGLAGAGGPVAVSQLLVTPNPNATVTPTPFQPLAPDGSPIDTTAQPTPSAGESTPLQGRLPRPDGQVNILVMGSDWRPNAGFRTDVMLLVSLDPKGGKASLLSFPRDLWVEIPGWEMQRLNTAQAHGGFALTQATFEQNFGITVDHYIMTNFNGFVGVVDTLGGIDVNAAQALSDRCDLPQAVDSYCNVGPGVVHMDGETALWYARARYSTSDFDRTRRAQEVMEALFNKLMSLNAVGRAPQLYQEFRSSVETDMALSDMLPLLPLTAQLYQDQSRIQRYAIGPQQVTSWTTPQGAAVLIPNKEACWEIIKEAIYDQ